METYLPVPGFKIIKDKFVGPQGRFIGHQCYQIGVSSRDAARIGSRIGVSGIDDPLNRVQSRCGRIWVARVRYQTDFVRSAAQGEEIVVRGIGGISTQKLEME